MAPEDVITEVRQGVSPICATCRCYKSRDVKSLSKLANRAYRSKPKVRTA